MLNPQLKKGEVIGTRFCGGEVAKMDLGVKEKQTKTSMASARQTSNFF